MSRSGLLARLIFLVRGALALLRGTYTGQLAEISRLCRIPAVALRLARRRQAAFVLVHHYSRLPFAAPLAKFLPVWLETQDVQAVLHVKYGHLNMIRGTYDPFSAMLAEEMRWVRCADAVVAISESELPVFRKHLDASKVFLCQPPVCIAPAPQDAEALTRHDILLVSSDNAGNLASLKWFMEGVWPRARRAGLTCTVVGNIKGRVEREDIDPKGIAFNGTVEHLAPWYASASVVVLPTVEGTGIGIKTIEAMAAGVPIVATTLAYRGLPSNWERPSPPLDDAGAFAEELVRLCRDPRAREILRVRVRAAYAALDLENRYRRQMRTIEEHIIAAGKARLGERRAA